jgi:sugar O-acyltransferase (sialic acid O-acetyltransferase NeuD family)
MTVPVIGLGAGGHAKVVIEILRMDNRYQLVGLLDPKPELKGRTVFDLPVLGDDDLLSNLVNDGVRHFFIGLGSVGDVSLRRQLYDIALARGMRPVSAVHPRSTISRSATLTVGVTIMAGAVINACAFLGANVIVNSGAIVEHDCVLSDHVHVATGARLASTVSVGEGSHIGVGASVCQCVQIGRNSIVGAGAVVISDVPNDVVVVGVPARILRKKET